MQPYVIPSCTKNLDLLDLFVDIRGSGGLMLEMIDHLLVPEPYHTLLVHDRDMTSTLSGFHSEEISLNVLEQRVVDGEVLRHVVLVGKQTGRPLDYSASRIRLDALSESASGDVLAGKEPLGGILNTIGMRYRSCPGGYIRVRPQHQITQALDLGSTGPSDWLFGRCNCLSREGTTLAEVVEILPFAEVKVES